MDPEAPTRIALKLRFPIRYVDHAEEFIPPPLRTQWNLIATEFSGITLLRLFTSLSEAELQALIDEAKANDPDYQPAGLQRCFVVECPLEAVPEELADALSRWESGVEFAYVESGPTAPPNVNASNEPRRLNQLHLDPGDIGIHVQHAWDQQIDGSGITLVDVEQGWNTGHEDLPSGLVVDGGNYKDHRGHGTAVVGICAAQQSTAVPGKGGIGIAPGASLKLVSQWRPGPNGDTYNTADAIARAQKISTPGDVILIEAQAYFWQIENLPVEVEPVVFLAIDTATSAGRIVVEAAGNGNTDLDTLLRDGQRFLERNPGTGHRRQDSGAILVAAGTSTLNNLRQPTNTPHVHWGGSNYGSGIDCYAWGEDIDTAGGKGSTSKQAYTINFGGTSGAAAIIAGVATLAQARAKAAHGGSPLPSKVLRAILSDPALGTVSGSPGMIGCMPSLKKLWPSI